jgi:hypothetical protein
MPTAKQNLDRGISIIMKAKRTILIAAFLLLLASPSFGAAVHKNAIQISPYNLIFTKIKINGREVLGLIDSGSFRTVELSLTLAKELKLSLTETTKVARRYEGKDFHLQSGRIESLTIGDYEKRNLEIDVIEGDIENISKQVNTDFEAILGWGFLSQHYTLLDYKNLSMQFSESPIAPGDIKLSINYLVINNVPVIKGFIDNQPVSLLFDTGAPMCNIDLSIAGAPKGEKVLKDVVIEKTRLPLEWRVKDLSAIKKSLECAGVIGNNLLKGYAVYFDTKNKVIHLH